MRISDWSSDVCSSDLQQLVVHPVGQLGQPPAIFQGGVRIVQGTGAGDHQQARILAVENGADGRAVALDIRGQLWGQRQSFTQGSGRRQRPRSEEHTSELQSLMPISSAVFSSTKNITKK